MKKLYALIVFLFFAQQFLPDLFPGNEWNVYTLFGLALQAGLFFCVYALIPHLHIGPKTIVFLLGTFHTVSFFNFFFYISEVFSSQKYWGGWFLSLVITYTWLYIICYREYFEKDDPLDDEHFFLVGVKPHDFRSFLRSLFNVPFGGVGVYAKGILYAYHKDYIREIPKTVALRSGKYRFVKKGKINEEKLQFLKSIKHSKHKKWNLLHNCKTVLEPIVKEK